VSGWTFVGHLHTKHSFDSLVEPRVLAEYAVTLGIHVLAVTDHDSWQGAVETAEEARALGLPLRVILASEVLTDHGDVIALFLEEELWERETAKFCDAVHEQGGLVLLPHPYRWHRLDEELLSRVDLVEVHNARTPPEDNARASTLARERGLPELVGPDAHRLAELGLARVEFDGELPADDAGLKEALLKAPRRFRITRGSIWNEWLSQGIKLLRQPSGKLAWHLVRGAARRLLKPGEYALE